MARAREQLELEKTRVEEREKAEECARIAEGLLTDPPSSRAVVLPDRGLPGGL